MKLAKAPMTWEGEHDPFGRMEVTHPQEQCCEWFGLFARNRIMVLTCCLLGHIGAQLYNTNGGLYGEYHL